MDPLSISAGIAGLLGLTIEITKLSYEYISSVKDAPSAAQQLLTETTTLENVLRDLRNKVVLNPEVAQVLQSLNGDGTTRLQVLRQCETELRSLLANLQSESGSSFRHGLQRLKWPFKEGHLEKKLERLRWCQSQLNTLATQDTLTTTAMAYKEIKQWRNEELATKVLQWFSPLDFAPRQHDVLARRHPGTVEWLLNSREFSEWSNEDIAQPEKSILWCVGPPGAGKTVASSVVVSHLSQQTSPGRVAVAYAYCSYDDQMNQRPYHIVGSVVKQLCDQYPTTPEFLERFPVARRQYPPTVEDGLDAIRELSTSFVKVFFVIDALDEAENSPQKHRSELLGACLRMVQLGTNVRVFATSRPHLGDINRIFVDAVRLDLAASPNDLQVFIRARIDENEDLDAILEDDHMFKEHIISDILEKSADQFLLPYLHIQRLNDLTCKEDVEDILSDLTSSVEETYRKTFERLKHKSQPKQELAMNALFWISHAKRPLSFEELQVAVAYRWDDKSEQFALKGLVPRKILLEACLGLVLDEAQSGTIRLAHKTLEQYFKTYYRSNVDPDAFIGRSLLSYLVRENPTEGSNSYPTYRYDTFPKELRRKHPLLPYAFHFWNEHARSSQDLFEKAILEYFATRPKTLPIPHDPFARTMQTKLLSRTPPLPSTWIDLFYAVVLQVDQLVRRLVQRGTNPFAYHSALGCPSILTWICNQYIDSVADRALLHKLWSEMILAIFQPEHISLAQLNVHWRDYANLAIIFPHLNEDAMDLVLRRGYDVHRMHRLSRPIEFGRMFSTNGALATQLHLAAFYCAPAAIERLLRLGADVNVMAPGGGTPLYFAKHTNYETPEEQKESAIRLLMEAGGEDRTAPSLAEEVASRDDTAMQPKPLLQVIQESQSSGDTSMETSNDGSEDVMDTREETEAELLRRRRAKSHVRRVQYQSTSSHQVRKDSFRKASTDALSENIVFEQTAEMEEG